MNNKENFPNKIPVFPLSNFIFFPSTNVPLNIFEPRYIQMINDSMKGSRLIGMVQPRKNLQNSFNELYNVGCLGKIITFNETDDGRYLIVLNGLTRFKIIKEIQNEKKYRECEVNFNDYYEDLSQKNEERFTFYITKAIDAYVIDKRYSKAYEIVENNRIYLIGNFIE